jgi:hypothetical protein
MKDRHWAQLSAAIGHEIRPEPMLAFQVLLLLLLLMLLLLLLLLLHLCTVFAHDALSAAPRRSWTAKPHGNVQLNRCNCSQRCVTSVPQFWRES